jgi:hypothetical protein
VIPIRRELNHLARRLDLPELLIVRIEQVDVVHELCRHGAGAMLSKYR